MHSVEFRLNVDEASFDFIKPENFVELSLVGVSGIPKGLGGGRTAVGLLIKSGAESYIFTQMSLSMFQSFAEVFTSKYGREGDGDKPTQTKKFAQARTVLMDTDDFSRALKHAAADPFCPKDWVEKMKKKYIIQD